MERMQNVLIDTAMVSVKALACSSVNSGVFETSSRNLSAENEPAALSSCWAAEPLTSGDFLTEVWAPVQEGMVAAVSLEHLVETFGWLLQGFSFGALLYFYLLVAGVHSQDFPSPFPALPHLLSYLLSALHPTLQLLSSSLHQPSSLFELFFRSPPSLHHLSHLRAWRCLGSKPARRQVQARGNANAESSSVFSSKLRLGCLPLQSKAWKGQLQIRICSTNCSSNGKHAKDIKWWSGNSSIPLDDPDRGKSLAAQATPTWTSFRCFDTLEFSHSFNRITWNDPLFQLWLSLTVGGISGLPGLRLFGLSLSHPYCDLPSSLNSNGGNDDHHGIRHDLPSSSSSSPLATAIMAIRVIRRTAAIACSVDTTRCSAGRFFSFSTSLISTAMVPYHAAQSRPGLVPQWTVVCSRRPLETSLLKTNQQTLVLLSGRTVDLRWLPNRGLGSSSGAYVGSGVVGTPGRDFGVATLGLFYTFSTCCWGPLSRLSLTSSTFQSPIGSSPNAAASVLILASACRISSAPCSSSSFVALLLCIIPVISEPGGAWAQSLLVGRCRQGATLMQKTPQCFPPIWDSGAFPYDQKLERCSCRAGYVQLQLKWNTCKRHQMVKWQFINSRYNIL